MGFIANRMPAAEVDITTDLVRQLIARQHPDLADLPVGFLANGWDNALFRVGERLVARLPRRALVARLIRSEQHWLPRLAPGLPPVHSRRARANILISGGRVSGVIDFGDITSGDPAADLSVAWMLLPLPEHEAFHAAYGGGDALWARARGWALGLGLVFLVFSADNPAMLAIGQRTLARVLA
jgi:aminoglycoside phosphotransferase (APT) family kinase protein